VIHNYLIAVPGQNACEIKMFYQEDAGLNVEMAKLAFAKGIWSYVCKMDTALRKYFVIGHPQSSSAVTAVTLIQKVCTIFFHISLLFLFFVIFFSKFFLILKLSD
jgi:hypothetical protein